jgi:hypothetical protein
VESDGRERARVPPWLEPELAGLDARYSVTYDAADRTVVVEDVGLPPGYTPRTVTVRLTLPAAYPQAAPRAELPWDLRYQGRVPRHLLASGQWLVRGYLGDPLIFFPAVWDQSDSLRTVVDAVLDDLAAGTTAGDREHADA